MNKYPKIGIPGGMGADLTSSEFVQLSLLTPDKRTRQRIFKINKNLSRKFYY